MATIDTAIRVFHTLFAALWAGSTVFLVGVVLPAAREGHLGAAALEGIVERFRWVSLLSVVVLFVTGGHLAGTGYTFASLGGTGRGHLVVAMVGLWFVLAGLLHVGTSKLEGGLADADVYEATSRGHVWFQSAGVVAVALLVIAGLL